MQKKFTEVEISIKLQDSVVEKAEDILLLIKLTNTGHSGQKLLFGKPMSLWGLSANVNDLRTHSSVVKYASKSVLSSQLYTEEELEEHYINLAPGQSVEGTYALSDIVVFHSNPAQLESGKYEIQLYYAGKSSNTETFRVIGG